MRNRLALAVRFFAFTLGMLAVIGALALAARVFVARQPLPTMSDLIVWVIVGCGVATVVTVAEQLPFWRERIAVKPKR